MKEIKVSYRYFNEEKSGQFRDFLTDIGSGIVYWSNDPNIAYDN